MSGQESISTEEVDIYEVWEFPAFAEEAKEIVSIPKEPDVEHEHAEKIKHDKVQSENQQLKESLQNKIKIIDEINKQMKEVVNQIEDEILHKIVSIMKQATHKIIEKEVISDKKTLLNMIDTTLKQIEDHKNCEVILSPDNYKQFNEADLANLQTKISVSSDLKNGDFKIKTELGEIIAILEDRLTAFFG